MQDERVLDTLRAMAWERAKGELRSYLQTYWPRYSSSGRQIDDGYDTASDKIEAFINDFENYCR